MGFNKNARIISGFIILLCTITSFINKKEYERWKKKRIELDLKEKQEIEKELNK